MEVGGNLKENIHYFSISCVLHRWSVCVCWNHEWREKIILCTIRIGTTFCFPYSSFVVQWPVAVRRCAWGRSVTPPLSRLSSCPITLSKSHIYRCENLQHFFLYIFSPYPPPRTVNITRIYSGLFSCRIRSLAELIPLTESLPIK